jgi:hypothetical protein
VKKRYIFLLVFICFHIVLAVWFFISPVAVKTDVQTNNFFEDEGLECTIRNDSIFGHPLRWVEVSTVEKDTLPIVLFTHGAPGAANNFFQFLTDSSLLNQARLIALDRLWLQSE